MHRRETEDGKIWEPTENARVCSWHFPNGREFPPSRFDRNEKKRMSFVSPEKRYSVKGSS